MNQSAATPAQKRMEAVRARASRASRDLSVMAADGEMCLVSGTGEGFAVVLRLTEDAPVDDREFFLHVADDHFWLLELYDRLAAKHRVALAEIDRLRPKPANHAAECAMKCKDDHLFRIYLQERHGLVATDFERIKTKVRFILAVDSLRDLNTDDQAAQRWKSLRADFDRWRKRR